MTREDNIQQIVQSFISFRKGLVKESSGMSHAKSDALLCLLDRPSVAMGELASMLNITSGAATQLTDALLHDKYITRDADLDDRRVTRIALSKEGRRRIHQSRKQKLKELDKVLSPLDDRELHTLAELLSKVSHSIQERKGVDSE